MTGALKTITQPGGMLYVFALPTTDQPSPPGAR